MRLLKIFVIVSLLAFLFLSCKKGNDLIIENRNLDERTFSNETFTNESFLKGNWSGEYRVTTRSQLIHFNFDIKTGGTLEVLSDSGEITGAGTWELNDSLFNAYYMITATQQALSLKGILNTTTGRLNGTWQFDNQYEDAGDWYLNKQN